jgi:hypothetical protein
VVFPLIAREVALALLGGAMLTQQGDEPRRQSNGPATSAGFGVIEDQAAVFALGTPAGMIGAIWRTRRRTGALVPATPRLAGHRFVVTLATLVRIGTAVLPGSALQSLPRPHRSRSQIDIRPLQTQGFSCRKPKASATAQRVPLRRRDAANSSR